MGEIAFLNGVFLPIADAKVSVNDRGFLFGDGVYEVLRTSAGRIWAMEFHLERLARSLREIDLSGPSMEEIRSCIEETYRRSGLSDALIYLQITRGVAPRSHEFPPAASPTFLIIVRSGAGPSENERNNGVRAITVPDIRWGRCDIKSVNLLPNVLAKQKAKSSGAFEAIFVRADGQVTEGASTNLFAVKQGRLLTREEGPHILSGVTRRIVLQIAREQGIPVHEGPLFVQDVLDADEVFLTGTTSDVLPVVTVDDKTIGPGSPGPMARRLYEAYMQKVTQA